MWDFDRFRDHVAIEDEYGSSLSYGDLEHLSERFADAVGKRCLVIILCENVIGSLVGYVASIQNRIVPMLLSASLEKELLDRLISIYHPDYLWIPTDQKSDFDRLECVAEFCDYSLMRTVFQDKYALFDELALLLTTSGSTGSPKFVRQSYENILANTESIVEYLHLDDSERPITTLPMNYTYGLSIINTHLYVGATLLVTTKGLMQKEFWTFFKEKNATSFGGVPYTYEMLERLRFFRMDLPSLRTMTQAGGKILPELHEKFAKHAEETGRSFVVMYGQCEATARMGYLPPEYAVEKKGSMGVAIPGGAFRLLDTDGSVVDKPHQTGELVYEGKNVTLGYAECGEDLIKGDERHGVLVTGDMAQFDEDGFYYIVGRKKRFLKIFGNRVNLDEMDRLLKARFDTDIACGGVDDRMFIFITDDGLVDDIRSYAADKTGLNPSAFQVRVIDEIPKTEAGKVKYVELEKYY